MELYKFISDKTNKINSSIYDDFKKFGYNDKRLFIIDVNYLLKVYNITINEPKQIRTEQEIFREKIINRDKCCIISGVNCCECQSAHIVPLNICNNYDIDNGMLLQSGLHQTFDLNIWCINPNNLMIEINKKYINNNDLSCLRYINKKINIKLNNKMLLNLHKRYKLFLDEQLKN